MNSDADARNQSPQGLAESEVAKMKAIAILYHSRGREKEAAAIFELIDKLSPPRQSESESA